MTFLTALTVEKCANEELIPEFEGHVVRCVHCSLVFYLAFPCALALEMLLIHAMWNGRSQAVFVNS